jgi:hypothetical protein
LINQEVLVELLMSYGEYRIIFRKREMSRDRVFKEKKMKTATTTLLGLVTLFSCILGTVLTGCSVGGKDYEYVGGYPTEATVQKAFDHLDIQRATQAYLDFMPMASQNALFESFINDYGMKTSSDIGIYTQPGEGKTQCIGLTYNTESIYAAAYTDLKTDGPTVIETPPNVLGIVDDGWMRFITDIGNAGPDKGKGGKYLLLPPGYDGDVPEGYFVFECPTYRNWIMVRGFVQNTGTGDDAIA